jgi:hypothetical protein
MLMLDKLDYEDIQYIIHVSLNSWMSLSITIGISYESSSLKDVASSPSLLLKTIKIHHLSRFLPCVLFYIFDLFILLEGRRLKLFANCSLGL